MPAIGVRLWLICPGLAASSVAAIFVLFGDLQPVIFIESACGAIGLQTTCLSDPSELYSFRMHLLLLGSRPRAHPRWHRPLGVCVPHHLYLDLLSSRGLLTRHREDQANLDRILGNARAAGAQRSNRRQARDEHSAQHGSPALYRSQECWAAHFASPRRRQTTIKVALSQPSLNPMPPRASTWRPSAQADTIPPSGPSPIVSPTPTRNPRSSSSPSCEKCCWFATVLCTGLPWGSRHAYSLTP